MIDENSTKHYEISTAKLRAMHDARIESLTQQIQEAEGLISAELKAAEASWLRGRIDELRIEAASLTFLRDHIATADAIRTTGAELMQTHSALRPIEPGDVARDFESYKRRCECGPGQELAKYEGAAVRLRNRFGL